MRPYCTDIEPALRDRLLCVYPSDGCEQTTLDEEVDVGDGAFSLAPSVAVIACIIVTPIQFIFELMCIVLTKMKSKKQCIYNCNI